MGEGGLDTVPDLREGGLDTVPDLGEQFQIWGKGVLTQFQIWGKGMGEFLHTSKLWGWGCLYTLPDFGEVERDLLWVTAGESFCKILVVVGC